MAPNVVSKSPFHLARCPVPSGRGNDSPRKSGSDERLVSDGLVTLIKPVLFWQLDTISEYWWNHANWCASSNRDHSAAAWLTVKVPSWSFVERCVSFTSLWPKWFQPLIKNWMMLYGRIVRGYKLGCKGKTYLVNDDWPWSVERTGTRRWLDENSLTNHRSTQGDIM